MLADHRSALRASLRAEYQLDLDRHDLTPTELADLAVWLPSGSAVWRSMGGPAAWSQETAMLVNLEQTVRAFNWMFTEDGKHRRNYPEPLEPPKFYQDEKAEQLRLERRIEKFKVRHMLREGDGDG